MYKFEMYKFDPKYKSPIYIITHPRDTLLYCVKFSKDFINSILTFIFFPDAKDAMVRKWENEVTGKVNDFTRKSNSVMNDTNVHSIGLNVDKSNRGVIRPVQIIPTSVKLLFYRTLRWNYNNKYNVTRLTVLFITWCSLYSMQYLFDSGFLNLVCEFKNPLAYFLASIVYNGIFANLTIWYIPFIFIIIWLVSLLFSWIFDTFYVQFYLRNTFRVSAAIALTNLARFQIVEFGIFLLAFSALLLNVKNSVINFDFADQTSTQIFHFNTFKPYTIIILCFILYGTFLFYMLQFRDSTFYKVNSPTVVSLFILLFLTMITILHTSHLILIIMCLETFALILLYFMIIYYERTSLEVLFTSILQFFMSQAMASLLYIYGLSWLSVEYISLTTMSSYNIVLTSNVDFNQMDWCITGFFYLILGLIMKIGIGPMGFWIFSVIRNLNFPTIAIYFTFVKLVYLLTLVNILQQYLGNHWENGYFFASDQKFKFTFIGIGVLSVIIGVYGLCTTDNLKSFLAYSSFINYGLIIPTFYFGGIMNLSYGFSIPYILLYSITTLLFIWMLGSFSFLKNDALTSLNGLYNKNKYSSMIHLILLSSLAGLPPFGGFFGKYFLLRELFIKMPSVATILIIFSIIAALGYARILINIFLNTYVHDNIFNDRAFDNITVSSHKLSHIYILCSIFIISFFGLIFYYYSFELCQLSFGFSNQYFMENSITILPQRDWLPVIEEMSQIDNSIKQNGMWKYNEITQQVKTKLQNYLSGK